MHRNHFIAQSNINNQPNPQISSILDRLQQLKRSMRPQVNTESDYESNKLNFGQNSKHTQKLNQYLPKENQQRLKQNQQGIEDYQSYRKSLEKKLNSLFQKQKQIFKVQSNFDPVKTNDQIYSQNQYTNYNDLQRKYDQFKKQQGQARHKIYSNPIDSRQMKSLSNINTEPKALQTQSYDHKQYRVQSTIQSNYNPQFQYHNFNKNKAEIDQMQRKIKLLEMKYLGQNQGNQNIQNANNQIPKKLDIIKESILKRQNKSRSNKSKYRKQRTQPQKSKKKCNTYHKQTIDYQDELPKMTKKTMFDNNYLGNSNKKPKFDGTEPNESKVPLKDYMKTLDHNVYAENQSQRNPTESQILLHKQFYELKQQFEQLLIINRSIVEKVQINEEQRMRKKQKKQRAKAMLKQILIRLEEIKVQIKGKSSGINENVIKEKIFHPKIKNAEKQYSIPLDIQKKEENNKHPKNEEDRNRQQKIIQESNDFDQKEQRKASKSQEKEELSKLKKLLDLQIKHRHLVQKKLELVWNKEVMID